MKRLSCLLLFTLLLCLPIYASNNSFQLITPENIAEAQLIDSFGRGEIADLAWSPDGERVFVLVNQGFWTYNTNDFSLEPAYTALPLLPSPSTYYTLEVSADRTTLVAQGGQEPPIAFNLQTMEMEVIEDYEAESVIPRNATHTYAFADKLLIQSTIPSTTVDYAGVYRFTVQDVESSEIIAATELAYTLDSWIFGLAITPDNAHLITGHGNGVNAFDLATLTLLAHVDAPPSEGPASFELSANGEYIAHSAGDLNIWRLSELLEGQNEAFFHTDNTWMAFAFSPDSQSFVYAMRGNNSKLLSLLDLASQQTVVITDDFWGAHTLGRLQYNPRSEHFYTILYDYRLENWLIYNLSTGQQAELFQETESPIYNGFTFFTISPSGHYLVASRGIYSSDERSSQLSLWRDDGNGFYQFMREDFQTELGQLGQLSFSPDETRMIGRDNFINPRLREWQVPSLFAVDDSQAIYSGDFFRYNSAGEVIRFRAERADEFVNIYVANQSSIGSQRLTSVANFEWAAQVLLHKSFFWDEREILVIPDETAIRGFNWNTGEEIFSIETGLHDQHVTSINPAGTILAVATSNGASLWNIETGEMISSNFFADYASSYWSSDGRIFVTRENYRLNFWAVPE